MNRPNGLRQPLWLHVLHQVARSACPHRREDLLVVREAGEDDDPALRAELADTCRRLNTVRLRHHEVHEHDVRARSPHLPHRFLPVSCFRQDFDVRLRLQESHQAVPDDRVVVHDQHPNALNHRVSPDPPACPAQRQT